MNYSREKRIWENDYKLEQIGTKQNMMAEDLRAYNSNKTPKHNTIDPDQNKLHFFKVLETEQKKYMNYAFGKFLCKERQ